MCPSDETVKNVCLCIVTSVFSSKRCQSNPFSVSVLNLMSLCGKYSLQFSLNKMERFLMVQQADPWVVFAKTLATFKSESEKCAVIDP